jgi:hypothetical protein
LIFRAISLDATCVLVKLILAIVGLASKRPSQLTVRKRGGCEHLLTIRIRVDSIGLPQVTLSAVMLRALRFAHRILSSATILQIWTVRRADREIVFTPAIPSKQGREFRMENHSVWQHGVAGDCELGSNACPFTGTLSTTRICIRETVIVQPNPPPRIERIHGGTSCSTAPTNLI